MFSFKEMSRISTKIYITCNAPGISNRVSRRKADQYFSKFDERMPIASPLLYCEISVELAKLVPEDTQVLAGIESDGIPVAKMLAQRTGLPLVMLHRSAGIDGRMNFTEGMSVNGMKVLIMDDVYGEDEGENVLQATQFLRSQGADVGHALALLDMNTGAAFHLHSNDVDAWALFVRADFSDIKPQ